MSRDAPAAESRSPARPRAQSGRIIASGSECGGNVAGRFTLQTPFFPIGVWPQVDCDSPYYSQRSSPRPLGLSSTTVHELTDAARPNLLGRDRQARIREDDTGDNEFPHPDVRWVPHAAPFFGVSPIRSAYSPGPSIGSTLYQL